MYNNAGYMYSVWPLKKLTLIPKYSIGITGNARYNANASAHISERAHARAIPSPFTRIVPAHKFSSSHISFRNRSSDFGT